jgi:hypothetical protein
MLTKVAHGLFLNSPTLGMDRTLSLESLDDRKLAEVFFYILRRFHPPGAMQVSGIKMQPHVPLMWGLGLPLSFGADGILNP